LQAWGGLRAGPAESDRAGTATITTDIDPTSTGSARLGSARLGSARLG